MSEADYKDYSSYRKYRDATTGNTLLRLLEEFPNANWNYPILSGNPNIPIWYIRDNPDKEWDYSIYASYNPNMTIEEEEKDSTIWENYKKSLQESNIYKYNKISSERHIRNYWLRKNPNCSWEKAKEMCENKNWYTILQNPNANWENILEYIRNEELTWNFPWEYVYLNKNIKWENIVEIEEKYNAYLNFYIISSQSYVNWDIVQKYPEYSWDYSQLSRNVNIKWEIVKNNLDRPWDFYWLSKNPNITWEIVRDNPIHKWCPSNLSENPNITWEIIRDNPDYKWSPDNLSRNPNLTFEIIRDNQDFQWDYDILSTNLFLYNNTVCKREYDRDVEKRRRDVQGVLNTIFYKDLEGEVLGYVGYD